ncbi:putative uncharacterized protein [Clostridium sp. CAG:411]|nr:putative uncharacterized protein [Clostridium sp. CAG:411]
MALIKKETMENDDGTKTVKKYFGNGTHISAIVQEIISETVEEEVISEQDQLNAELLLNQATILENQQAQDEVLAEILLNQAQVGGNENV